MIGASLLMIYEPLPMTKITLKLIDFAHSRLTHSSPDFDVLFGLDNLLKILMLLKKGVK